MSIPIFQIDAFADRPFSGNPAAVVILKEDRPADWMQAVAAEMNLSETAFVRPIDESRFHLRWCTPAIEVDLCGHATVAAAHALWESGMVPARADICFESRSGDLTVRSVEDEIELNFPLTPPQDLIIPQGLSDCFTVDDVPASVVYSGRSRFDYLLEVPTERDVQSLVVDFAKLKTFDCRGIIVTAAAEADQSHDFVSRFFAPAAGVDEDPVIGSAHCCLADFWSQKLGRSELIGYQASQRGGIVKIKVENDRVLLRGTAVTVFRGELLV